MEKKEILPIFKEMAREVFNKQEDKHHFKRKYKEQYFLSDEEVENLASKFEDLLAEQEEKINYEHFLKTMGFEGQ